VEYALDRNWSLKAEYLYVHLGTTHLDLSALPTFANEGLSLPGTTVLNFNNNLNIVRLGANYRF
jgi:outer membrane immunogenic protein